MSTNSLDNSIITFLLVLSVGSVVLRAMDYHKVDPLSGYSPKQIQNALDVCAENLPRVQKCIINLEIVPEEIE